MPFATGLGLFGNFSSVVTLQLTTAGVATGRATIEMFGLAPPNISYGKATFFKIYTTVNSPYSVATFNIINFHGTAVLTPGFQTTVSLPAISTNASMALVSGDFVTNGILTRFGSGGIETSVLGPPDALQVPFNSLGLATVIAASGNTTSPVINSYYYPHVVMGITSTQGGALNIQRYIDTAGTIINGVALTATLTANTAGVIDTVSTLGFGSFTVQITNTGTVPATISAYALLLLAR